MMYYHAFITAWLLPMAWSANVTLFTSLRCGSSIPINELAAIASTNEIKLIPGDTCVDPKHYATFKVTGVSETELVAMLLRWDLDASYGGYNLNAVTVEKVNDVALGPAPAKAFLQARQVSAPMGVALVAFGGSGIASIFLAISGYVKKEPPSQPTSCYMVVSSTKSNFY